MGDAEAVLASIKAILGEKETYKNGFDLLHLHSRVASALSLDPEFVPFIQNDIDKCTDNIDRENLIIQRDILKSRRRWSWFYSETKEYIKVWESPSVERNNLLSSVRQYIEIVRRYFPWVSITWEPLSTRVCKECGATAPEDSACPRCGDNVSKDSENVREKRNTAGSVDNFMRCIKAVTVSKCDALPVSIMSELDDFARSVGMYTSEEVRAMPLQENGKRGPYSIIDLMEMLKVKGYTVYYPEKWWVAKHLWGWESQNVSPAVEEEIKRDCASIFSLYANENKEGGGSINREWLAVRILLNHRSKLSRPLSLDDFDIIKTPEILESYESLWNTASERYQAWNSCPIYGRWNLDGK